MVHSLTFPGPKSILARLRETRQDIRSLRDEVAQLLQAFDQIKVISEEAKQAVLASSEEIAQIRNELAVASELADKGRERALLAIRMVRDDDASARELLWSLRKSDKYEAAFQEDEPLVTVLMTTYMNWPLIRDISLPSIIEQTYENYEVIVVGDAAPDETRRVVESFNDHRIKFVNLPYRGPYPPKYRRDKEATALRLPALIV